MKLLKRKILLEDDEIQEKEELNNFNEPSTEELLTRIGNGEISESQLNAMLNNGEISEETFNDVKQRIMENLHKVDSAETEMQDEEIPQDNSANNISLTAQDLMNQMANGELSQEDFEVLHQEGNIPDNVYSEVINTMNVADPSLNLNQEVPNNEEIIEDEPELEPQAITNPFKLSHLYDNFLSLKKYIKIYIDAFSNIALDQITDRQYKIVSNIFTDISDILEKLIFYITKEFNMNDYNRNLYVYLMYNKKFSENIIKLRRVLQLNNENLIDKENDKK